MGRSRQDRKGVTSLGSGYLEKSADLVLVWDHSCLLWGTGLAPKVSNPLVVPSLQLQDVSMIKAKGRTGESMGFPWTEHAEAVTHPLPPGSGTSKESVPGKRDGVSEKILLLAICLPARLPDAVSRVQA